MHPKHERWHHALDVQMDTQKYARSDEGLAYNRSFFYSLLGKDDNNVAWVDLAHKYAVTLHRADTIYVTSDMLHVILQAAHDLPEDYEYDEHSLLCPFGFVYLEEPIQGEDKHGTKILVHAFAWEEVLIAVQKNGELKKAVMLYFLTDPDDLEDEINAKLVPLLRRDGVTIPPLTLSHMFPIIVGSNLNHTRKDEQGAELVIGMCKLFVALNLIAQQPIGEPQRIEPNRAVRKRAIKWDMHNQRYITLITLRRKRVKSNSEPQKIERTHRWIVQGFWRRQPDKHGWHWCYIHEHIRGPENMPLIIRERRVFNFRR